MEHYSIALILMKVNNLSDLNETNVVEKIKSEFTLARQDEEIYTERQAIETAFKDWTDGGSKIDHFFKFNTYPYEISNPSIYEQTLLHFAAKHGYQNVVNALLKAGAKIDVMDVLCRTPLHLAAHNGYINVVNTLIAKGANVDVQMVSVYENIFATDNDFESKCKKAVEILRKQEITFDVYGDGNKTLLRFPSEKVYQKAVKILADAKVDIMTNCSVYRQDTPLHCAAENGHINVVNALIKANAGVNAVGKYENTPLHLAAKNGHINVVNALIKANADVNVVGECGNTPLHLAAKNGHESIVEALCKKGANINAQDTHGDTPLHLAAKNGHKYVVEALYKKGANINEQSGHYKNTPLHLAVFEGHAEVVQYLIGKKANVLLKNREGWIPSDCVNRGIPKLLKEAEKSAQTPVIAGVVVGVITSAMFTLIIAALLVDCGLSALAIAGIAIGLGIVIGTIVVGAAYMISEPSAEIKVEHTLHVEKIAPEVPMPG